MSILRVPLFPVNDDACSDVKLDILAQQVVFSLDLQAETSDGVLSQLGHQSLPLGQELRLPDGI